MNVRCQAAIAAITLPLLAAGPADAQVLAYPNGQQVPGELSGAMGGAAIALATGPEAAWFNPAGIASEPSPALTAGTDLLQYSQVQAGSRQESGFVPAPAFAAFSFGADSRGGGAVWSGAIALHWPSLVRNSSSSQSEGTLAADQIAPEIDPGGLEAFQDGIQESRADAGIGEYRVLSSLVAGAVSLSGRLRLGFGLEWQRVDYLAQASSLTAFEAISAIDPIQSYQAHIVDESRIEGQIDRLIPVFALQARPLSGFHMGIYARLPSRFAGGEGSIQWSRSSGGTLDTDGGSPETVSTLVTGSDSGRQFELRTPLEVGIGFGFAGSRASFELDLVRSNGLENYTVQHMPESQPPSTGAFEPRPFRTGALPTTRWRTGFALLLGANAAWAVGVRDESSDIQEADAVFRKFDLYLVSTAWTVQYRNISALIGLNYLFGSTQRVSFPTPLGDSNRNHSVELQSLGLRVAGTWLL